MVSRSRASPAEPCRFARLGGLQKWKSPARSMESATLGYPNTGIVTGGGSRHRNDANAGPALVTRVSHSSCEGAVQAAQFGSGRPVIDSTVCPPYGGPILHPLFGGQIRLAIHPRDGIQLAPDTKKDPRTWLPESLAGVLSGFESLTLTARNPISCVRMLSEKPSGV
jgi:hypothetical protein